MTIEFGNRIQKVRFDDAGIEVDERLIAWSEVGAFGILANASRRALAGHSHGGAYALPTGCLAICVNDTVDVIPAFGLLFDCVGSRPTGDETARAIEFLQHELGELWQRVPAFAPAMVRVEDWWREQVYGPDSHAHTDDERVKELRAELAAMRDRLHD